MFIPENLSFKNIILIVILIVIILVSAIALLPFILMGILGFWVYRFFKKEIKHKTMDQMAKDYINKAKNKIKNVQKKSTIKKPDDEIEYTEFKVK